jgi:hypothetical protein
MENVQMATACAMRVTKVPIAANGLHAPKVLVVLNVAAIHVVSVILVNARARQAGRVMPVKLKHHVLMHAPKMDFVYVGIVNVLKVGAVIHALFFNQANLARLNQRIQNQRAVVTVSVSMVNVCVILRLRAKIVSFKSNAHVVVKMDQMV